MHAVNTESKFYGLLRRVRKYARRLARAQAKCLSPHRRLFLARRLHRLCSRLSIYTSKLSAGLLSGALTFWLSAAAGQAQTPVITGLAPASNANAVARSSDIAISFSTTMNVATLTAATIRIYGSQSGFLSTRGSFSGNQTRNFNPALDFKPGEEIMITVTGAGSLSGDLLARPLVYAFRAAPRGSFGVFESSAFGGGSSTDVAVGDLDGDGILDAVVANFGQAQEIWLGNGDGSFSTAAFGAGNSSSVELGDLDGDGDLDALIVNNNQAQEIWLNNGDASFTSSTFGSGQSNNAALGDLDGDGDLDAILVNNSGSQEIWLNNGDASFATINFDIGSNRDVAIGDIDGDGDLDAILADASAGFRNRVWFNNGDASFSSTTMGPLSASRGIALGDLDGDGDLDALVSNDSGAPGDIWLNNGDGSFNFSTFGAGSSRGLALGDLDGDGDLDAVIANTSAAAQEIWHNNGDGTFTSDSFGAGTSQALTLGDLDGDGDLDAIIANTAGEAQSIWLKAPVPRVTALVPATNALAAPRSSDINISFSTTMNLATLTAGNIRIHGSQSGFLGGRGSFSGNQTRSFDPDVKLRPGELISVTVTGAASQGNGRRLDAPLVYSFMAATAPGPAEFGSLSFGNNNSTDIAIGDLNGDGRLDALVANFGQAQEIWLGNGDGSFSSSSFGAGNSSGVALGDLDGDGDLDAIIVNNNQPQEIWLNNGNGSFVSSTFGSGAGNNLDLGDLDGDGDLDAIIVNNSGSQEIWLNNGDGSFATSNFDVGSNKDVAIGDIDGDGDLDAILADASNSFRNRVWFNNGDATFSSTTMGPLSASRGIVLGDLDGDGDLDAVVSNDSGAPGDIWLNNGDGSFSFDTFGAGSSRELALGDLDGDGDLDALIANTADEPQDIWLNNGDGTFSSRDHGAGLSQSIALGDLDGDGDLDAIVANTSLRAQSIMINTLAPRITSLTPATNALAAARDADIDISFSTTMIQSTLDADNILVYGSQSGFLSTRGSFSGDRLRSFDPTENFKLGEMISVTVTGATNLGGRPLGKALVYNFHAAVSAGQGSFSSSTFGAGGASADIALGDLDGDGDLDAIITNFNQPQDIWLNNGDGNFALSTFGSGNSAGLALGDLDCDGDLDAIITNFHQPQDIWLNNGDGSFTSSTFGTGLSLDVRLGDLDGDGDLDAIIVNNNFSREIWLNNGDGSFTSSSFANGIGLGLGIGDLDGDGDLDAIVGNYDQPLEIWRNNGDASFSSSAFGTGRVFEIELGDLDGDGDLDAIVGTYSSADEIWFNNGDGSFASVSFGTDSTRGVELGDLDGDGDLDAIVAKSAMQPQEIWRNNGDGSFSSTSFGSGTSLGVAIGDIDLDGDLDAIVVNNLYEAQEVWRNLQAPRIRDITPNCVVAGSAALPLAITGQDLIVTRAQISVVNGAGVTTGTRDLVIGSVALDAMNATIPAGLTATAATLTLTLHSSAGSTTTSLNVEAPVAITGASCGCPAAHISYRAMPPASTASHSWSVVGGSIVGGQGSDQVDIVWDQGAAVSVALTRSYAPGCTSAALLAVSPKTLIPALDHAETTSGNAVTLALLSNDIGSGLTVSALEDPFGGSASVTNGVLIYIPDSGFSGLDQFSYSVRDLNGCQVTGSVLIAIAAGAAEPADIEFLERAKNRRGAVRGLRQAVSVEISPDGRYLYAAGRGDHSIAVFSRSVSAGTISYVGRVRNNSGGVTGMKYVYDLALSPKGDHLYAAGYGSNSIVVFRRNTVDGTLHFLERKRQGDSEGGKKINGLQRPRALVVSPDGRQLCVASYSGHALSVFQRNTITGLLTWRERQRDGSAGVDGLRSVLAAAYSPDGRLVYAAGFADNAIAVFERNITTGSLSFVERLKDGEGGTDGLAGASDVTVSPDGRHVYATGKKDDALVVFLRNTGTGELSFVERQQDGVGPVDGLNGACGVAVSPDGSHVWAIGSSDDALALFERSALNGRLNFVDLDQDGVDGIDGLDQVQALVVSPASNSVYCASLRDNAISVFSRNRRPVANHHLANVSINSSKEIAVLTNDSDPDNHALTVSAKTDGALGTVTISGGGASVIYSAGALPGADSFSYTIDDGHGASSTASVSVNVVLPKRGADDMADERGDGRGADCTICMLNVSPNPLVQTAQISFELFRPAHVQIYVSDLEGRVVARLLDGRRPVGRHETVWRAKNGRGAAAAPGTYLIVIEERGTDGSHERLTLPVQVRDE